VIDVRNDAFACKRFLMDMFDECIRGVAIRCVAKFDFTTLPTLGLENQQ
jgi:hypothetical protein